MALVRKLSPRSPYNFGRIRSRAEEPGVPPLVWNHLSVATGARVRRAKTPAPPAIAADAEQAAVPAGGAGGRLPPAVQTVSVGTFVGKVGVARCPHVGAKEQQGPGFLRANKMRKTEHWSRAAEGPPGRMKATAGNGTGTHGGCVTGAKTRSSGWPFGVVRARVSCSACQGQGPVGRERRHTWVEVPVAGRYSSPTPISAPASPSQMAELQVVPRPRICPGPPEVTAGQPSAGR